ncbi:5-formyltetrahydrofolate cyclo-ligase [Oculatella sp. LEGE 06141]|uniref:5-formyltetrahydrofolate cyclo-ligase n=1 Tax=Oculatella sp. LEGE 06141 TaxID=1828648 RepID=UPI001880514B|nr:5-formyltetrahydrofolate cyclo-ligase [Oculatella sp. LEGE 06141]MBE9182559.1 5-formyltetrahydrofolate cyclo-ligase [Oculatella sp. LEGE 06141]
MDSTDSKANKATLRRSLLKARQGLPEAVWRHKSDRLCAHLQAWPLFSRARTVLAYFSFRQEPDLSPLFSSDRRWGFPRCVDKALHWHQWSPEQRLPLQTGSYGIVEPHPEAPMLDLADVDLLLVPAIACDVRGYRLGYGGGFYDRLLSSPAWARKPAIGIVFEFARLPSVPIDPWDRPLKGICTEAGLFLSEELTEKA